MDTESDILAYSTKNRLLVLMGLKVCKGFLFNCHALKWLSNVLVNIILAKMLFVSVYNLK